MRELEGKKHKEKTVVVSKHTIKTRIKEMVDFNSEAARKIKENFRSNMATVVVSVLNSYRKPDCKEGRITNTEEFKHLARKVSWILKFLRLIVLLLFFCLSVDSFRNVKRNETYFKNRRINVYRQCKNESQRVYKKIHE